MVINLTKHEIDLCRHSIQFLLTQFPCVMDRDIADLMALEKRLNAIPNHLDESDPNIFDLGIEEHDPFLEFKSIGE